MGSSQNVTGNVRTPAMARSGSALIALALAAVAAVCLSSSVLSFVGSFAPTSSAASLRTTQRAPAVEMAYYGGSQPQSEIDFDQRLYVVLMTIIFALSVLANSNGFYNP